jgi:hypothetical protein
MFGIKSLKSRHILSQTKVLLKFIDKTYNKEIIRKIQTPYRLFRHFNDNHIKQLNITVEETEDIKDFFQSKG